MTQTTASPQIEQLPPCPASVAERQTTDLLSSADHRLTDAVLDTVAALIVVLDTEGRIVRFNRACERLSGYTAAEVIGKRLWDLFIVPAEMDAVRNVFGQLRSGQFPNQHRNFWRRRDGRLCLIDWTNTVILDERGDVRYIVGTGIDISERKTTSDALLEALDESRRRQAQTEALLDAARCILQGRDINSIVRSIYDSCKRHIGAGIGFVSLIMERDESRQTIFIHDSDMQCSLDAMHPGLVRGLLADAFEQGMAVYENDVENSPFAQRMPSDHIRIRNVLIVPLRASGRVVGLMGLGNKPGGFDGEDARLAMAFGTLIAIALVNSRSMDALMRSEERFRSVVETATDAIICTDGSGAIIFCNEAAQRIFGYHFEEVLGKPASVLLPERSQRAFQAALRRFANTGKVMPVSRTIEITGRHKDGSELPLEFSLTSWGSKDGFFFTGICRDISERKQAQQRQAQLTAQIEAERRQAQNLADTLARERDILQAIMESTSTMLAYLDRDFNFVLANSAYVNASGHSREELIGHNHFDLFPNAENQAIFERVRDTGQPVEYHAKPFTYADQPERGVTYWDWTLAPVRTASGQIEGVVLALLDVTQDVRRAEERERLLREMATQQAVAAERERLSRELHDGIAQSLGYVRFRLRSVKDLLMAGRMAETSAGLAELEDVVRGINANLRESILGLRATAAVRDVGMLASLADYLRHFDQLFDIRTNLIVEPDAVTQFAPATEVQIFAIIQEAMINIRKHAQTGRATVRFSRVGDEAIVAIADQGRGFDVGCIPAGHYGLSIMRERADLINGKLQVVSEPGQGTTIILRLPVT